MRLRPRLRRGVRASVRVVDGCVAHRAEAAIDAADDAVGRGAQLLVLRHVGARGDRDLQQHDLVGVRVRVRVRVRARVRGQG